MTDPGHVHQDDMTDEERHLYDEVGDFLSNLDLTERQRRDLDSKFNQALNEAVLQSECDHESVRVTFPPDMTDREGAGILESEMSPGTLTGLRANCTDCGADIAARLEITVDRGDGE